MPRYDDRKPSNSQRKIQNVPLVNPRRDNIYKFSDIKEHAARTSQQRTPTKRTTQPKRSSTNRNLRNTARTSKGHQYSINPTWLKNIIAHVKNGAASGVKTIRKYCIPALVAVSLAGVGVGIGATIGNIHTTHSIESAQETMNTYSPTALLNETENLINATAKQEYAKQFPHDADTYRSGTLIGISPVISDAPPEEKTTILLHYSCYDPDAVDQTTVRTMNVRLSNDFVNDVCTPYFKLRDTMESIPEGDLNKIDSWIKLDGPVQELTEGLQKYAENTKDKSYGEDAKQVLEDSSANRDNDGDER